MVEKFRAFRHFRKFCVFDLVVDNYNLQKQSTDVFYKKAIPKNFTIFQKNTYVDSKKGVFRDYVNIAKFLRISILKDICERLFLDVEENGNDDSSNKQ